MLDQNFSEESKIANSENTFFTHSVPIIIVSFIIWFISTIYFGKRINTFQNNWMYIVGIICYIFLWGLTILFAFLGKNFLGTITLLISAGITGYIESPIIIWSSNMLGSMTEALNLFYIVTFMGIVATICGLGIGYYLDKKFDPDLNNYLSVLVIFGLVLIISEIVISLIFGYNSYNLIFSIITLIWITIAIIYDGAMINEEGNDKELWLLLSMNIFLDLIIIIVRLFIVMVYLIVDWD